MLSIRKRKRIINARGPSTTDSRMAGLGDWWLMFGNEVRRARSFSEWAAFSADHDNKRVASTKVGDVWISTVFLGLDHNYSDIGPPVLFETMVFVGEMSDRYMDRYCTRKQALAGHARIVDAVRRVAHSGREVDYAAIELAITPDR